MALRNHSTITEFILIGLSDDPHVETLLFVIFLGIYLLTIIGNLTMLLVIRADSSLHTPMYFFLSNLSFLDLCFSSVTVPKLLEDLLSEEKTISVEGCLTQVFFVFITAGTEAFLLSVMAYDRYAAICRPLHYSTLMSPLVCMLLLAACWVLTSLAALLHTLLMAKLSFCAGNTIHHFFCDVVPLLQLSCSDTSTNQVALFTVGSMILTGPLSLIILSYARIIPTILGVPSALGRQKAFSTCGSHLTVVFLFYGTAISVYLEPPSSRSGGKDRVAAVFYTVVTPMLNPFIYSLRNNDVKMALKRLLGSHTRSSKGL